MWTYGDHPRTECETLESDQNIQWTFNSPCALYSTESAKVWLTVQVDRQEDSVILWILQVEYEFNQAILDYLAIVSFCKFNVYTLSLQHLIMSDLVPFECTGTPTMFVDLLSCVAKARAEGKPVDTSSLRTGIISGASVPEELMRQLFSHLQMGDARVRSLEFMNLFL